MRAILLNSILPGLVCLGVAGAWEQELQSRRLALVGGRVYPSPDEAPIDDAVVIIDSGRIAFVGIRGKLQVPEGTTILDCSGLVVVAGFQNSHVHFTQPRWNDAASQPAAALAAQLSAMLTQFGFTTVVDTGSDLPNTVVLRRRIEAGDLPGPRILTAGTPVFPPEGVPFYVRESEPPEAIARAPQPRTPGDAAAAVERQLAAGADVVKLFTGSWVERGKVKPMAAEVAAAAVRAAHDRRRQVFAHPSSVTGLEIAVRSGVDILAHPIDDTRGFSRTQLEEMKAANVALVPTLHLFRGLPEALDQVRDYARMGGDILFGTDVGYLPDFDHTREYELMAAAGLGWREVLASLTTTPARRFREQSERGRVESGMAGDLVVLGADPIFGAGAFARVRYTIRNGEVIFSSEVDRSNDDITELKRMQRRIVQTLLAGQRDEYAAMLAPEWRVTHVDGRLLTKEQVLQQMFTGGPSPLAEAAVDDIEVRLFGDSAVVTGRTSARPRQGEPVVLRFTDFAVKRDGRWVIVASHATALEPQR